MKLRSLLVIASSILTASILYASDDEVEIFQGPPPPPKKTQPDPNNNSQINPKPKKTQPDPNNNSQINPHIKARDILDQKLLGKIEWWELVIQLLNLKLTYNQKRFWIATASTENTQWSYSLADGLSENNKRLYRSSYVANEKFRRQYKKIITTSGCTFRFSQVDIPGIDKYNIRAFCEELLKSKTDTYTLTPVALYIQANQHNDFWNALEPFFKNNLVLRRLGFYSSVLVQGINPKCLDLMSKVINGTRLSVLTLIRLKLNDDNVSQICETLKKNQNIKALELLEDKITDKGGSAIYDLLLKNKNIINLNLSDTELSQEIKNLFKKLAQKRGIKITL